MKKRGILLIIFLNFIFFMGINNVSAATCADIDKEIDTYNTTVKDLKAVDCTNNTDSKIVNQCNKLNLQKSQQLSKLYKYKDLNKTCASQIDNITAILDSNKDSCSLVSDGFLEKMTKYFMGIFYIIGPVLVILFGTLDYTKAVVASDPGAMKQATNKFTKRIFAVLLLFLTPTIVNFIIGLNTSDYVLSGDSYVCGTNYINLKKTYTIKYVPKVATQVKRKSGNSSTSDEIDIDGSGFISGDYEGYMIRTKKPTMADKKYFNPSDSNVGQCVWYVKSRAKEILNTVSISASARKKALSAVNGTFANAKDWWGNASLKSFGSSSSYKKPKVGAIIVWGSCSGHPYGHVGMIEKVNSNGTVNYTEGWTNSGSCPNSNMSCVSFNYRKNVNLSQVKVNSMGEPFKGYIYLLD